MSMTSKINFRSSRIRGLFKGDLSSTISANPHVYRRSAFEEYQFNGSEILLNGVPVQQLLKGDEIEVQLWAGLAAALEEFRRKVREENAETSDFNGQVEALLNIIMGKMTRAYDEVTGGVRVQTADGRFWVNNIDPRAVLTLYLSNPTEKRRCYLEGVLKKLGLILEGKVGRSQAHGILAQARALYRDIYEALCHAAPSRPLLLTASSSGFGR